MRSLIHIAWVGWKQWPVQASGVIGAVLEDAFAHGVDGVDFGEGEFWEGGRRGGENKADQVVAACAA